MIIATVGAFILIGVFILVEVRLYRHRIAEEQAKDNKEWMEMDRRWRDILVDAQNSLSERRDFKFKDLEIDYEFSGEGTLRSAVHAKLEFSETQEKPLLFSWFIPHDSGWQYVEAQGAQVGNEHVLVRKVKAHECTVLQIPLESVQKERQVELTLEFAVKDWALDASQSLWGLVCRRRKGFWRHVARHDTERLAIRFWFPRECLVRQGISTATGLRRDEQAEGNRYILVEDPFKGEPCGGVFTYMETVRWQLLGPIAIWCALIGLLAAVPFQVAPLSVALPIFLLGLLGLVHVLLSFLARVLPHGN